MTMNEQKTLTNRYLDLLFHTDQCCTHHLRNQGWIHTRIPLDIVTRRRLKSDRISRVWWREDGKGSASGRAGEEIERGTRIGEISKVRTTLPSPVGRHKEATQPSPAGQSEVDVQLTHSLEKERIRASGEIKERELDFSSTNGLYTDSRWIPAPPSYSIYC